MNTRGGPCAVGGDGDGRHGCVMLVTADAGGGGGPIQAGGGGGPIQAGGEILVLIAS